MKLSYAEICNYRSIKRIKIEFDPSCRILVGINEAGKSNILSALSMLSEEHNLNPKRDVREHLMDEDPISEAWIRFIIEFNKVETKKIVDEVMKLIPSVNKLYTLLYKDSEAVKLFDYPKFNQIVYICNIISGKKYYSSWSIGDEYSVSPNLKKPSSSCPPNYQINIGGTLYYLSKCRLIEIDDKLEIPVSYLETPTLLEVTSILDVAKQIIVEADKFNVILWKYSESQLLPNAININQFADKPDLCEPLWNMFLLAGHKDVKESITNALSKSENQFRSFLNRIAKKTTTHFKEVWCDYDKIEFELRKDGDKIVPGIRENNVYDFEARSEGFKRFVTFLLTISVDTKNNFLSNALILIDEPDLGLHPSASRSLRDELLRIAQNNMVVYGTHSIFMIDTAMIERHYLVTKQNEVTSIAVAGDSSIADEEVLYNALGYSIFDTLKPNNVIFEGWRDKQLFAVYLKGQNKELRALFEHIGRCHAKGVKNITSITPIIELSGRKCIIVSDADAPAKEQQKTYRQGRGYGKWFTYKDLEPCLECITSEDFIDNELVISALKTTIPEELHEAIEGLILPIKGGKMSSIKKWLGNNGVKDEEAKALMNKIKDGIIGKVKYKHISSDYGLFVNALARKLGLIQ